MIELLTFPSASRWWEGRDSWSRAPDNDHVPCRDVLPQHLTQSKKGRLPHEADKAFLGLKFIPMSQEDLKIAMGSKQAPLFLRASQQGWWPRDIFTITWHTLVLSPIIS